MSIIRRCCAENWQGYSQIMDSATLYHTGALFLYTRCVPAVICRTPGFYRNVIVAGCDLTTMTKDKTQRPKVIAHVSSATRGSLLVEPEAYAEFHQQVNVNIDARCDQELYHPGVRHTNNVMCLPCSKEKRISILRAAFAHAKDRQNESRSTARSSLRRAHSIAGGF